MGISSLFSTRIPIPSSPSLNLESGERREFFSSRYVVRSIFLSNARKKSIIVVLSVRVCASVTGKRCAQNIYTRMNMCLRAVVRARVCTGRVYNVGEPAHQGSYVYVNLICVVNLHYLLPFSTNQYTLTR